VAKITAVNMLKNLHSLKVYPHTIEIKNKFVKQKPYLNQAIKVKITKLET
jgi:hypothetical protein